MHRLAPLAFVAASTLLGPVAFAEGVAPGATHDSPLATGLEALRTSDYARAERELSSVRGADAPAAMVALARTMIATGRYADAERVAKQVTGGAADKLAAVAVRAEALFAVGKVADAIKLLEANKDATGPAARRVRLLLGEYRIASGHRADADEPLMKIVEEYNDGTIANSDAEGLAIVGHATHLLRSPKDANTAFVESERVAKRVETLEWHAALFIDKYDPGHTEEVLREALAIAPHDPTLLAAMARVKLDETLDFDAADKMVKDALAVNPKLLAAFAVRAGIALRDMDLVAADAAIGAGLAVNPNDLELLSLRAATRFLSDDRPGYEAAKREVLARNGEYSTMYSLLGEFAEWEHRYDDIVAMMKEATQLDPEDSKAWAELGLTELRSGDEPGGLEALRRAWTKDHFNVRVFNTLNLYEQSIANDYDTTPAGGVFKVRLPKDEKKVLERYVPRMLEEAWGSMKGRYGFVPTTPVQIELYSTREQFSVRTSGLPNVGIEGVCFGRVVAAMTPKSEPFNWGNVVWHELGHVFAIQLSKNHVPRWFTEGLSEYETIARRPEWKRELDPDLYLALTENRLPGAADMNRAFTHAADGADMTVAYYAASQMLVFTVESFGMPKVIDALKLWGQGVRTPEVIQRAFGLPAADYDARYRAWQMQKLARYRGQFVFRDHPVAMDAATAKVAASPNDVGAHVELAIALLRARKGKEAQAEVDAALKLDPQSMPAHYVAAKLAAEDPVAGMAHLAAIKAAGGDGFQVEMGLAELAGKKKDKVAMRAALESAHRFDPSQSEPVSGLYGLANDEKRDADALSALRELAMLEQHDRTAWRALLQKLVDGKMWDEAKKVGESAIFVDVESPLMHTNYARALAATGGHDKAVFELESALACDPQPKDAATVHALLAQELVALHRPADARPHLAEALKLDPRNPEAAAVRSPDAAAAPPLGLDLTPPRALRIAPMGRFTLVALLPFVALAGCSRAAADQPAPAPPAAAPPPPAAPPPADPAPAAPSADASPTPFPAKTYRAVLQTGDSMVGGGLCRALQPRFAAEGTKFIRDVWESGSIEDFADADRLPKLLAKHDPDLVLLTMGANDVGGNVTDYLGKKIEKIVAMTQKKGARDCVWITPPKWRVNGKPVLEMIRAHVSPCVLFDSTNIEMQRKPDKVHPDEKGGDQWAVAFWHFFRGPDADAGAFDIYTGVLK